MDNVVRYESRVEVVVSESATPGDAVMLAMKLSAVLAEIARLPGFPDGVKITSSVVRHDEMSGPAGSVIHQMDA